MTWLYVLLALTVVVAACGVVPLRRYQDRMWAAHQREVAARELARQWVSVSPAAREMAKAMVDVQIVFRDALTPSLHRVAAAMAELAPRIEAIYRELPWWRRVWLRIRMRFTR